MGLRWQKNELQHKAEFDRFVKFLLDNNVRSYLEIGSKYGGSLWGVGSALRQGSTLVAVERAVRQDLLECVGQLRKRGQRVTLAQGDSRDEEVIKFVKSLGPFDAVLIDGAHDTASVAADYKNYGPMGRMVAFHDARPGIVTDKKPWKADVANFFESIADERSIRIMEPNGIGFGIIFR